MQCCLTHNYLIFLFSPRFCEYRLYVQLKALCAVNEPGYSHQIKLRAQSENYISFPNKLLIRNWCFNWVKHIAFNITECQTPKLKSTSRPGLATVMLLLYTALLIFRTEGLTEDSVKRYLLRKPMSSKDLFKCFKSKKLGLTNEELVESIAKILQKLNTTRTKINGVFHFSMSQ